MEIIEHQPVYYMSVDVAPKWARERFALKDESLEGNGIVTCSCGHVGLLKAIPIFGKGGWKTAFNPTEDFLENGIAMWNNSCPCPYVNQTFYPNTADFIVDFYGEMTKYAR